MDYRRELLGGSSFLERYQEPLNSLCRNQRFVDIALSTFREATKKTGSDTSKASKNIISDALFRERAYLLFPEYALIVDDVAQSGYSKKSAVLSIYYATKILNASVFCEGYPTSQATESAACQQDHHTPNSSSTNARRIWEEIAFIIDKYRKDGAPEREFQIEMENAFEKLGWSRRLGEVVPQCTIPVGSAHSVRPDLVIAQEGTPIFVVELKKPSAGTTLRNADQLFSYMRLLKLNVGLLVSDTIQLYYDDPSNADNPQLAESIPAKSNCEEGPILLDLLMRDGFDEPNLVAHIAEALSRQTILAQAQNLRSRLLSEQGAALVNTALTEFFHSEAAKDIIRGALRTYLQKEYSQEVISQALDGLDIRWDNRPRSNDSPLVQTPVLNTHGNGDSTYSSGREPSRFQGKKVGQIANDYLRGALESGAASPEEIRLMETRDYSKRIFGINYPLLVPASSPHDQARYYATPLFIRGIAYKLCNDWYESPANNDRPYLISWLQSHAQDALSS